MKCDHCHELQEEIDFLKRQMGLQRDVDVETRFAAAMRLSKTEAAMLAMLYRRRGSTMSKGAIWDALYLDGSSEPEMKIIDVYICKIRRRIGNEAILTLWGQGYSLSPDGVDLCANALSLPLVEAMQIARPNTASRKATGVKGVIPILRRLAEGSCRTPQLRDVLIAEQRHNAAALALTCVKAGRARQLSRAGRGPHGSPSLWEITDAGRAHLAEWDASHAQQVAA